MRQHGRRIFGFRLEAVPIVLAALLCLRGRIGTCQETGAAGGAYSFYESDGNFLETVRPMIDGEDGFVARTKALAGDEEPFCLVLSGGSARAFAHIGVLEALEEAGIHPDFIVANSMGAIVSLLYAAGVAPGDIERLFEAVPAPSLFDLGLPLAGGFVDTGRFMGFVRALMGDLDAGDLPIPVLVLCEDLVTRREVRLVQGDVVTVMAASIALPAIFPPVKVGDALLVDGGVVVLVPADIAYEYSGKVAVATALYDRKLDFNSAFVDINRAIDILKTRNSVEALLARRPPMIRCDVEGLSYMEYSRPAMVARRGYDSARAVMPDILALSPPRPMPPALLERRAFYHDRITSIIAARDRGTVFPVPPSFRAALAMRLLDEAEEGLPALAGRRYAGLAGRFRVSGLEVDLSCLGGLSGDPSAAWGVRADARIGGGPVSLSGAAWRLGASAWVFGSHDPGDAGFAPAALIFSGEAGLAMSAGRGGFLPRIAFASSGDLAGWGPIPPLAWELDCGASIRSPAGGRLSAEAGLRYLADSLGNGGASLSARASVSRPAVASLRLRAGGRAAFEGPGWDASADTGFRGVPLDMRAPLRASGGLDALWLAERLEFDVGELLAFRAPELGIYADFAAACASVGLQAPVTARLVAGIAASVDVCVLGLSVFGFSAYCGYGFDGSGWSAGLRMGRLRH